MMFDGKAFAARRREELLKARSAFGDVSLAVVMGEGDPVTSSFVRVKERNADALHVRLVRYLIPNDATTEDVLELIGEASKESGMIVQLPLPSGIEGEVVLAAIPPEKDVDALSPASRQRLEAGDLSVIPPVAAAIYSIIKGEHFEIQNKKSVVVGKGRLVGAPCASLLSALGAEVVIVDKNDDVAAHTKSADIIVLGAGAPHFLKPEMVKEGVVIFDAGTSESSGVVVGDANPAVAEKASFFTPTPGGIGPVAVVEIFGNLFNLLENKSG